MISNEMGGLVGCRKVFKLEKYCIGGFKLVEETKYFGRFTVSRIS